MVYNIIDALPKAHQGKKWEEIRNTNRRTNHFDSEEKLDTVEDNVISLQPIKDESVLSGEPQLDEKTLEAQASLKGSVGGVQALLEIQSSYAAGTTTYDSAIAMLDMIFGYNKEQAVKLLGSPEKTENTNDTTT